MTMSQSAPVWRRVCGASTGLKGANTGPREHHTRGRHGLPLCSLVLECSGPAGPDPTDQGTSHFQSGLSLRAPRGGGRSKGAEPGDMCPQDGTYSGDSTHPLLQHHPQVSTSLWKAFWADVRKKERSCIKGCRDLFIFLLTPLIPIQIHVHLTILMRIIPTLISIKTCFSD